MIPSPPSRTEILLKGKSVMIDHLIFDFDGTISDSYPLFLEFVKIIGKENGLKLTCSDEELDRFNKITLYDGFVHLGWNQKITYRTYLDRFYQLQNEYAMQFRAFPEAVELLEYAVKCGKSNYIYTHSGSIVGEMLKNMGIDHLFTFLLDSSYNFPLKPAPDALLYFLERFSLDPKTCMMIGDRPIDAQAGMNAGMAGCLWDAGGLFPDAKVDHIIAHLEEVKDLL